MQYKEDFDAEQLSGYGREGLQSRDGRERALSVTGSVKVAKSNDFFKTTRVDSCSYVVMKNGVAQAIPFRPKPKQLENAAPYNQTDYQ